MSRSLRVLHIVSGDLWAGAEVQAFTLMLHLKRMPRTEVAAVVMNDLMLADRLRSSGIAVYITDERKTGSLQIFSSLCSVLRCWQPDLIHTHREKENILGCLANRTFRNVPSIRTVHGSKERGRAAAWQSVRHGLVDRADLWCGRLFQQRIIAVTEELAGRLARDFVGNKVVVIENGIDFEMVTMEKGVAEFRAAEPDAIHVGIAGRLVDVKRLDLFIGAAAILLREHPERQWRFHIFGDGPRRSGLEELAARLQLGDRVRFHGHRHDIATCVGGLDALVICSDHEGLPMISLEAAALAVPTVAHAVGGLMDVVPEEFLVYQHDAFGYKDGILRVLREDARSITVARAAERVVQFSARRNAEKVRALYEEVITERSEWNGGGEG